MTLTDAQIDRYSRQIVVPRVGGRGQERLLAARLLLAGDPRDIESPLAYLVGAGVGKICLNLSADQSGITEKTEKLELNSDVAIELADQSHTPFDLALAIIGSDEARKIADEIANNRDVQAVVIARVDVPGKIIVIPDMHRPQTLDASMLSSVGARSEAADFIAMLATAEAFKLLAGYSENPSRSIIEFDGHETLTRVHP